MEKRAIARVDQLVKVYAGNENAAVDHLSLDINELEIFGLLGPNGAGKTTTISIMCGLLQPSSGTVSINGYDVIRHLHDVKQLIGVVSQDIALYEKMTAYENLYYFGTMFGLGGKGLRQKIDTSLHRLGLHKNRNVLLEKYSGGMKRRINLLAGTLHNPKLLFLDEPTVGVDVQTRNVIREYLAELRENGTTIIYSSHLMEDIEQLCDRVAIIDHGKLICDGSPRELIAQNNGCDDLEDVFLKLTGHKLRD